MYILQYSRGNNTQLSNKEPFHKMVDKLNNLINYIKVLTDKCLSKLSIRYGFPTKLKTIKKRIINLDVTKPHKKMYTQVLFTSREKSRHVTTASLI
jgi:hypothetical protein